MKNYFFKDMEHFNTEKKLTITHYANTSLKAVKAEKGTQELYPMYIKMVYDKQTLLFKSRYIDFYVPIEFENNEHTTKLIAIEYGLIEEIVKKMGSSYHKHNFYSQFVISTIKIFDLFGEGLKNKNNLAHTHDIFKLTDISKEMKINDEKLLEYDSHLHITLKTFSLNHFKNNYEQIKVIDWIYKDSIVIDYQKCLNEIYTDKYSSLLLDILTNRLLIAKNNLSI